MLKLNNYLKLDFNAQSALSLLPPIQQQKQKVDSVEMFYQKQFKNEKNQSILEFLDHCYTKVGKQGLRNLIVQPLIDKQKIQDRLDVVDQIIQCESFRSYLKTQFFKFIPDLNRLSYKFHLIASDIPIKNYSLEDAVKLYQLVGNIKNLVLYLEQYQDENSPEQSQFSVIYNSFYDVYQQFEQLLELIEGAVNMKNARLRQTYRININYSKTIKRLTKTMQQIIHQQEYIKNMIQQNHTVTINIIEKEDSSNSFMQTSEKNYKKIEDNFRRYKIGDEPLILLGKSQGKVQFTTKSYDDLNEEYASYEQLYKVEYENITKKILKVVSSYYPAIEEASKYIQELDILNSFATTVLLQPDNLQMCRPIFNQNQSYELKNSYHPCLNQENIVTNDIKIQNQNEIHIIQGPNMGGKSTYIRQIAINVLLAHLGCYVCAGYANINITDSILTRVGASDSISTKVSTFMNEMMETKTLIENSSKNSLCIIDELGRGTSTQDGLSLAWSVCKYFEKNQKGSCLFATHFQELSKIKSNKIKIFAVQSSQDQNCYKLLQNYEGQSFGIEIIKMLNFPNRIIENTEQKLLQLQEQRKIYQSKEKENIQSQSLQCNILKEKQYSQDTMLKVINLVKKTIFNYQNNYYNKSKDEYDIIQELKFGIDIILQQNQSFNDINDVE